MIIPRNSNQCALDVSVIYGKPEVHPKIFSGKKTFKKCKPSDFKFYPSKLTINKTFPYNNVKLSVLFCIVYGSENGLKFNITA